MHAVARVAAVQDGRVGEVAAIADPVAVAGDSWVLAFYEVETCEKRGQGGTGECRMGSGENIPAEASGLSCAPCSGKSRDHGGCKNGEQRAPQSSGFVNHSVCPEVCSLHLFLSILTCLSGPVFPDGQVPSAPLCLQPAQSCLWVGLPAFVASALPLACLEPSRRGDTRHCHQGAFQGRHCQRSLQATCLHANFSQNAKIFSLVGNQKVIAARRGQAGASELPWPAVHGQEQAGAPHGTTAGMRHHSDFSKPSV